MPDPYLRLPEEGEVWVSGRLRWRCLHEVAPLKPGERMRIWECISSPRDHKRAFTQGGRAGHPLGARATFGDDYVRTYWRRETT